MQFLPVDLLRTERKKAGINFVIATGRITVYCTAVGVYPDI